jgi:hypothetical protein
MGTPEYVAPEQATDARTADTRADVYSLGCTLYFLLTGRPPFVEDTPVKLVLAHIEKEPRPLHELRADVPPELSAVVDRMLAKDPGRRYQTPIDAVRALAFFCKPGQKVGSLLGSGRDVSQLPAQREVAAGVGPPFQDLVSDPVLLPKRLSTGCHLGQGGAAWRWPARLAGIGVAGLAIVLRTWLLTVASFKRTGRFFLTSVTCGWLARTDQTRSHFRDFLRTILKRFVSIHSLMEDSDRAYESPDTEMPEEAFDRAWKAALLQTVRRNLEAHYAAATDPEERLRFQVFAALHLGDREGNRPTQEAVARRFGITRDQVRYAVEQVRKRSERLLRQEIRDQVGVDGDVEEEIRKLF